MNWLHVSSCIYVTLCNSCVAQGTHIHMAIISIFGNRHLKCNTAVWGNGDSFHRSLTASNKLAKSKHKQHNTGFGSLRRSVFRARFIVKVGRPQASDLAHAERVLLKTYLMQETDSDSHSISVFCLTASSNPHYTVEIGVTGSLEDRWQMPKVM